MIALPRALFGRMAEEVCEPMEDIVVGLVGWLVEFGIGMRML